MGGFKYKAVVVTHEGWTVTKWWRSYDLAQIYVEAYFNNNGFQKAFVETYLRSKLVGKIEYNEV